MNGLPLFVSLVLGAALLLALLLLVLELRHRLRPASPLELASAGLTLGQDYPLPVVRHDEARALTLQRYAVVKKAA